MERRVLVDTTVWVDALRGRTEGVTGTMRVLLREDRVVTCGPVRCELHRGLRSHERTRILPLLDAVPTLNFGPSDWDHAGVLDADLRSHGITLPPFDVLIARIALREGVPVFTLDAHFASVRDLALFA